MTINLMILKLGTIAGGHVKELVKWRYIESKDEQHVFLDKLAVLYKEYNLGYLYDYNQRLFNSF